MKNFAKILFGIIILVILFVIYYLDRAILWLLPIGIQSFKGWMIKRQNIKYSIVRIIVVYLLILLVILV